MKEIFILLLVGIPILLWCCVIHFTKEQTQVNISHKIYKGIQSEECLNNQKELKKK